VLSDDCPPSIGGAHLWLYEVYKRWPGPVCFMTREQAASRDPAQDQGAFDRLDHGALRIRRALAAVEQIDLLDWRYLRTLRQHVRAIHLDTGPASARVHALRAFPEGFAGLLAKVARPDRIRLITYAHGEETLVARSSMQLTWMAKLTYRASDLVIANSENTKRLVLDLCPTAHVERISPGVDVAAFRHSQPEIDRYRSETGLSDCVLLGTIARMEPRKNHAAVIRSVALLCHEGLRLSYICAGDGPERPFLIELARSLGVSHLIRFPGIIPDRDKTLVYASLDVHVMPSIQVGEMIEGFGIAFLEAAAAGRPSVCGASGGQAEAVRDGKTGVVVDGRVLTEVAGAIRRLALDHVLRVQMGHAARRWAEEHDWQRVLQRTHAAVTTAVPEETPAPR
jgi:phosphatidylinositol alpha-1,6-mannosyltransferase